MYDSRVPTLDDQLRGFLKVAGIRLNTDLGQHFLIDEEVLQAIIDASNISPTDHIVEIGPGVGILTAELLARAGKVTAIELDIRMIKLIPAFLAIRHSQNTQAGTPALSSEIRHPPSAIDRLNLIHANALQASFPSEPYSVIANIPYHITSPLLRHAYLESKTRPTAMTLLIQKEVAEKICDLEHAGLLTIMVGLFGKATLIRNVPPQSFLPPPEVDSAVLRIESYLQPLADSTTIEKILRLLKMSFAGKRKMLRNTLGKTDGGMELLKNAEIDPMRRPETLTVEDWIRLAKAGGSTP